VSELCTTVLFSHTTERPFLQTQSPSLCNRHFKYQVNFRKKHVVAFSPNIIITRAPVHKISHYFLTARTPARKAAGMLCPFSESCVKESIFQSVKRILAPRLCCHIRGAASGACEEAGSWWLNERTLLCAFN